MTDIVTLMSFQTFSSINYGLCSLLATTNQFSIFIGRKMQLTGWENANNTRNATCADTQTSNE